MFMHDYVLVIIATSQENLGILLDVVLKGFVSEAGSLLLCSWSHAP